MSIYKQSCKHESPTAASLSTVGQDAPLFLLEGKRGNVLSAGQNVWPEISWMTWGTMTLWCCACWKEATSSVPTWWTGLKILAATPTKQSPWGSTSFASRATWWAPAAWAELRSCSSCLRLSGVMVLDPVTLSEDESSYATLWQWYLCVCLWSVGVFSGQSEV